MKELVWEITDECLNKCIHCSSCLSNANSFPKVVTPEKFEHIVRMFRNIGFGRITLSGGEPALHPQFNEIVDIIDMLDLESCVYTSGVFHDGQLPLVGSSMVKLTKVILSFFSFKETIHNEITGNAGSFAQTLDAIRYFSSLGVNVEANIVPMRLNQDHMSETAAFLKTMGVQKTNILKLVKQGSAERNWQSISTDADILGREISKLVKDTSTRVGNPFGYRKSKGQTCGAGHEKVCITYDGYILPCEVFKKDRHLFANIYEENVDLFHALYKLKSLDEIVTKDKHGCYYKEISDHLGLLRSAA